MDNFVGPLFWLVIVLGYIHTPILKYSSCFIPHINTNDHNFLLTYQVCSHIRECKCLLLSTWNSLPTCFQICFSSFTQILSKLTSQEVFLYHSTYNLLWSLQFFPVSHLYYLCIACGASQVVLVVKNPPANAGDIRDADSFPGSGRSPGGGNGNTLQYSSLENPKGRGTWWVTVRRVAKSQTRLKPLSTHTCTYLQVSIYHYVVFLYNSVSMCMYIYIFFWIPKLEYKLTEVEK